MPSINYDFSDKHKSALIHFDRPIYPVPRDHEIELRALQGLERWKQTKEAVNNPNIGLDHFFMQLGYSLQEFNRAFWINERRRNSSEKG